MLSLHHRVHCIGEAQSALDESMMALRSPNCYAINKYNKYIPVVYSIVVSFHNTLPAI